MTMTLPRIGVALALAAAAGAAPLALLAQDQTTARVAASTDWSVFVPEPTECFAVSAPTEQVNTRDGAPVTVTRGETLLFVSWIGAQQAVSQVSFTGGYPFAAGSMVSLDVAGTTFQLFTADEWAWAANPEEDARIVAALKGGSTATLTGQSGRGTVTRDTFSLVGFTSAVDDAASRCAG